MRRRHFQPSKIPAQAHPLARRIFAELNAQERNQEWLARASGVSARTIDGWKRRHSPTIVTLEACFNALGYDLDVVKRGEG